MSNQAPGANCLKLNVIGGLSKRGGEGSAPGLSFDFAQEIRKNPLALSSVEGSKACPELVEGLTK